MENLNLLVTYAKNPKKYNKDVKKCLDEFFIKTNTESFNPDLYCKTIEDCFEQEIYNFLYEKELSLKKIEYRFEEAYFLYASQLLRENNLKEAIFYLEKSLLWNPVKREALLLLSKLHFSMKNFNKAYEYAVRGLKIEFNRKNLIYYYSVLIVYHLQNKEYGKADEYAINLFLLDNKDAATRKYLERRKIDAIYPNQEKSELIMDSLLTIIYNKKIHKAERARYAKILVSYEILPIFKYDKFYLILESGAKSSEIKESVIVGGKYLISKINGENYFDIKDKKGLFEKLIMTYFEDINECNLHLEKYADIRQKYEEEAISEEIKIKYNGNFYYIANTANNPEIANLYLEMKENIIRLATILTDNFETIDNILGV